MTMCSRSLLLLFVLCLVEVAQAKSRGTVIKDDIDLAKCVATRKDKGSYFCVMQSGCIQDSDYVQVPVNANPASERTTPNKEKCATGASIRPISDSKWEIEMKKTKDYYIAVALTSTTEKKVTMKLSVKGELFETRDGIRVSGSAIKFKIVHENKPNYVRFELEFTVANVKTIKVGAQLPNDNAITYENEVILFDDHGELSLAKLRQLRNYCYDLTSVVLRKKSFAERFRSKMPDDIFDHNTYDFTRMCPTNYKAFLVRAYGYGAFATETAAENYNWKEIAAIECAANRQLHLLVVDHETVDSKEVRHTLRGATNNNYDFIEVTCRTLEDDCYHCDEPAWNKAPTGESAWPPSGHKLMTFTSGEAATARNPTKCPVLTCETGYLPFYPQINFTSQELPQCTWNEETNTGEWTITVFDGYQWERPRVPLEKGYCWKKTHSCAPLDTKVHTCPKGLHGFKECVKPKFEDGTYNCNRMEGVTLHAAPTRRSVMVPVQPVKCDKTTGEFTAILLDGETAKWKFADESWLVCKRPRFRQRFESTPPKERHILLRALIGAGIGIAAFLIVCGVILIFRIPVVLLKDFFLITATTPPPPVDPNLPPLAPLTPLLPIGGDPFRGIPDYKRGNPLEGLRPNPLAATTGHPTSDTTLHTMTDNRRSTSSKKKEGEEEPEKEDDTCIEPDEKEMLILKEADRLQECTDDEDATGKEVGSIHLDRSRKEQPKDGTKDATDGAPKDAKQGSKKETPKEDPKKK